LLKVDGGFTQFCSTGSSELDDVGSSIHGEHRPCGAHQPRSHEGHIARPAAYVEHPHPGPQARHAQCMLGVAVIDASLQQQPLNFGVSMAEDICAVA
jgi:hypothetical protein